MIAIKTVENKDEKTRITLEVFTCVWDEENPCLFMVKVISEVMTSDY